MSQNLRVIDKFKANFVRGDVESGCDQGGAYAGPSFTALSR